MIGVKFILGCLASSLIFFLWVIAFFIFDAEILNGYFKHKLQDRFKAEK